MRWGRAVFGVVVLLVSAHASAGVDSDNDGVDDASDPDDFNPDVCGDVDFDACDDCSIGTDNFGPQSDSDPSNDGLDTDGDGACNLSDLDDDNDGALDGAELAPLQNHICGDSDGDTCDDCTNGVDGFGPLPDAAPLNDGPDADADGLCDA